MNESLKRAPVTREYERERGIRTIPPKPGAATSVLRLAVYVFHDNGAFPAVKSR